MTQSTTFAQVATNLLNVLQGYTKGIRFLLVIFLTLTVTTNAWGATETITAANGVYSGSGDNAIHTWTLTSCTVVQAKGSGTAVNQTYPNRWYQNNKITFTPKSGYTITQIVLTGSSSIYHGQTITASTGSVSTNSNTYTSTWSGSVNSSSSLTLTLGKQFRFGSVTITYSATTANPYTVTFHTTATKEEDIKEASAGAGVTPPTMEEECGEWEFQGWSESSSNSETSTTPLSLVTLTNGKYYPTEDIDLYPVYTKTEDGGGSVEETLAQTLQYDTWSYSGSTTNKTSYRLFHSNSYVESAEFDLSTLSKVVVYGGTFGGDSYNKLTIAGVVGGTTTTWKSVTVSGSSQTGVNTYTGGTSLSGTGKLRVTSNSGSSSSSGVRISKIMIYTLQATSTTYYYSYPQCVTETAVTLNPNGGKIDGSTNNKEIQTQNGTLTLPTPTRDGYNFAGWNTKIDGLGDDFSAGENKDWDAKNTELFAQWTAKTITITWNLNYTGATSTTSSYTYDGATIALPTPTRTGYSFNGWFTAATGGTKITEVGTTNKPTENVTYYAQWISNKTATSLSWSAATYSATIDVDNEFPTLTKSPADLSPIAYSSLNTGVATIDANGNITLLKKGETTITATFEETPTHTGATASYTLTVNPSNCRWVEVTDNSKLVDGDEVVIAMQNGNNVYALPNNKGTNTPEATVLNTIVGNEITTVGETSRWTIEKKDGKFIFHPNGNAAQWLYCINNNDGVCVGTGTAKQFFLDPTTGHLVTTQTTSPRYIRLGTTQNGNYVWRCYTTNTAGQTLKFYKKTCLPANKFWIDYELANVTCTTDPIPSQIDQTGEDLLLEFSANDGYKLPETISVKMGETEIGDNENYCAWDKETGDLLIAGELITDNITITIEGCEQLAAPENLLATNITSTSAVLSWDAVAKTDEYIVFVTDGETNLEIPTTNCTITIEGLSKNTYYLWDVTATADNYCDSKKPSVLTNEFTTLDVYTVTFNTDGGTDVAPQTVDAGSKITAPANPSAAGYTFNYWYTTDANVPFDFDTPITGNTTLNAKWTPNVYTITFYKQSGTGGTDNATVTFNSNNYSVSTIEAPTRDKYAFGGYYTEQHGAGIQVVNADGNWLKNVAGYTDANGNWIKAENTHLYAKWTAIYTITWVVNNNTETPYHTSTVLSGSTIDQLPTPPADDLFEDCEVNAFVGWSTDNIGLEPDATAPTDLFKTIAETQSKIGAINGDKKFYAVYASEVEQIATFEADGLNGLSANSTLKWTHDNSGISLAISAGQRYTGSPKTFTITNGTSNYCEIVAPEGKSLKKAVVSITGSNYKVNSVSSPWSLSTTSSTTQTITTSTNAADLKMYATSSYQIRITQVDVTYTTYSNYITRCTALPDPVWGGATIDKTEIAVNCGETSSTNGAARISFPKETNYNLYKDITVEVTSGNFIIASSRDGEYTTSVTLSPTQNGENVGTFANKYVYVRAVAPPMSSNQLTGTITISGKQITTQVINVSATVTCNEYTLTFNDCGETKTITDFAGTSVEEMEPWAEICSEPVQYVFDGWATAPVTNGTEEYGKVDFSIFTMPNNNTTILYAVYRYAEEGGEPVNGFVKVTEALSDWSGDYVIVDDEFNVAIQNTYEEDTKDNKTLKDVSVTIENDKIVSPTNDIIWTISKSGEYYTMYNTEAIKYAGITKNETRAAGLSETIATGYSMNIIFDSNTKIAKVSSTNYNRCFSYSESYPEWRTYSNNDANGKTGYLYRLSNKTIRYTSSLVCGSIEAENAMVTSTVGQTVKVYVPITLGYSDAASITGTSDNEAFTVVTKNDVAVGESNIEVHYKPTAYVNTANQEETATITLTTSNGATTTFNVTGRCLPEAFVIAAKWGNNWYALPANMSSETTAEGLLIEVDNPTNPAKAIAAPNTTKYSLKAVYKSNQSADRFAECGNRLVFVEEVEEATPVANKTLYNGGGDAQNSSRTNIQVYAQYSGYYNSNPDRYEWIPTTTDLKDYTLISAHVFTDEAARTISLDNHGVFGTLLQNKSYNGMVRLLPVESFYTPTELQVVEWKEDGVSIMYTGSGTKATTKVGNNDEGDVQLLSEKKIDHAVYTLSTSDLIAATNQVLTISIKGDDGNIIGTHKMTIPWILNSSKSSDEIASEVTQATDIVVLNGAILTAANTKYTYDDVVVYPGGKLVIGVDGKLGMYSLTFRLGSSWGAAEYEHKYPEFVLNTTTSQAYTNTSGKINLDYVTTKEQYYTFVAPFAVNTQDIKYPVDIYGNNVAAANKGSFEFQYYDGAERAEGNTGWKVVEEDPTNGATLTAHQGYTFLGMPKKISVNGGTSTRQKFGIHRIPMTVAAGTAMTHENSVQSITVAPHPSEKNNNSGWNLIGNPYMTTITGLTNEDIQVGKLVHINDAQGNWTGKWQWDEETVKNNQRFLVIPSNDGQSFESVQASNATLPAFKNFFVQVRNESANALSIPRTTPAAQLLVPARRTEELVKDVEVAIVLEQDEEHTDQMDFLINNIYTEDFERDADFTKMMNATNLNLYGVHPYDNLSFVAIDNNTARGSVAIGYQVPQAGEYTLRMSDKPYVMFDKIEALYVTDHAMSPELTVDLMNAPYEFSVNQAETNNERFTISLILKLENQGPTTGWENIDVGKDQSIKFIYLDQLYILRNGIIYDATGQQIQTINK